jgi:hypothetical protein
MKDELYARISKVLNPLARAHFERYRDDPDEERQLEALDALLKRVAKRLGVSEDEVFAAYERRGKELQRQGVLGQELGRLVVQHAQAVRTEEKRTGKTQPAPFRDFDEKVLRPALPFLQRKIPGLTFEEARKYLDESWDEFLRSQGIERTVQ